MKIGMVSTYFTDTHANNELELCRGLVTLGHDVTLFTSNRLPPRFYKKDINPVKEKESFVEGFKVIRVPVFFEALENPYCPNLERRILQDNFDLVHGQEYYTFNSWQAYKASKEMGVPFVFTQHRHYYPTGFWMLPFWFCDKVMSNGIIGIIKGANGITAISEASKYFLVEGYDVPPERIDVIPHGVASDKYHPQVSGESFRERLGLSDEPIILTVGRLTYDKGIDMTLKMLPTIKKKIPSAKLVIVGRGPDEMKFRELAKQLSIEDSAFFVTKYIPTVEMPSVYAACDVFVLPSRKEVLSIAMLEAMASGKPIVASKIGGMQDAVVHGGNGFLMHSNDQIALNRSILTILQDETLKRRFGRRSREIIEDKFSWIKVAEMTAKVYERCLKRQIGDNR